MTNRITLLLLTSLTASCATGDPVNTSEIDQEAAAVSDAARWPGGLPIHYWIDSNLSSGPHADPSQTHCSDAVGKAVTDVEPGTGTLTNTVTVQAIEDAITAYEAQTPVRFTKLTSLPTSNPGYPVLIFTRGETDSNPHAGGRPVLNSSGNTTSGDWQGCVFLPPAAQEMHTIEHETGHQLGMIHEQRRSDYCSTVKIDETCLSDSATDDGNHPFATITGSQNLTPYDTDSIMEYRNTAFCDEDLPGCGMLDEKGKRICAKPTIMKIGCTTTTGSCAVGGATDFSKDDINTLYRMYEPSLGLNESNDQFGAAMVAGDFDGDGYDDLAVGAPNEAPGSEPATGAVILFKGTEGGLVAWKVLRESNFTSLGASVHAGDRFGASLAAGKYFNHTNSLIDDLIIGAPGYRVGTVSSAGAAFVYKGHGALGNRQPEAAEFYPNPATTPGVDYFGSAVAMGELDGTHGAIAVGAPFGAKYTVRNGLVWTRNVNATSWTQLSPDGGGPITWAAGTSFGSALAIGDLTANGSGGLAVGAPSTSGAGRAWVYSGALALLGTVTPATSASGDQFGRSVVIAHMMFATKDYLAIGAPNAANGGSVTVFDVTTSGITVKKSLTQSDVPGMSPESGDQFGFSLAAGDLDGDLFDDLVIGVPGENSGQGVIALVKGQPIAGWAWRSEKDDGFTRQAGDRNGWSVAVGRFGDVDDDTSSRNDAPADIATGAPYRAPNGVSNAGAFQEFFGQQGAEPTFGLGFDQEIVHGVQPASTPSLTCTPQA